MTEKTSIVVEPGKPTIVITRVFDAPRRLVFDAWTKPEHLMRWWGPRDLTLSAAKWTSVRAARGASSCAHSTATNTGSAASIARSSRPTGWCTRFASTGRPVPEAVETLTFVEKDGKTTLTNTMLHTSVENRDAHVRSGMEEGALQTMDRLAELLDVMSRR